MKKANARWATVLAVTVLAGAGLVALQWVRLAAGLNGLITGNPTTGPDEGRLSEQVRSLIAGAAMMDPEGQGLAEARKKDPAWKPACQEVGLIQIGDSTKPGALKNFCVNAKGNILACFDPQGIKGQPGTSADQTGPGIRVYSPGGELLETLPLDIRPAAIGVAQDGSVFVAGQGRLLKLDAAGKVLASAPSPVANEPVSVGKEILEMIKQSGRSGEGEVERMRVQLEQRRGDVTGLGVTAKDVFIAVPAPSEFTFRVYRFDHALQHPTLVAEKLRGCCGQMDIQARDDKLWISHNARHKVESRDRDGAQLAAFGKPGKVKASDFGGCCEPKNIRVLPNGDVLAAESGPPTCIKRFSAGGEFLGVVAVFKEQGECVRVTVDVSPDGSRYYLLDTEHDAIRIFGTKA